jgi:2-methylfumaryl-CoA hydratase
LKLRGGRFFEDFRLGQRIVHPTPRTITDGDCALYIGLTGARQILHSATPVAAALGYPDRPVDDLLVFHVAFGKTVPDISLNAIANLGYADVRFLAPCYSGDTLRAESEVIGLRETSNRRAGIVYVRSNALNQRGELVLTWARWVMVNKRRAEAPAPEPVAPMLPEFVPPERLAVPGFLKAAALDTTLTGAADLWDDYEPGERIDHPSGMTLDEAEHTLATKLYQNNARVHFDELAMKKSASGQSASGQSAFGRRLVYGGHVISICRALSYDGLENALSIAAINGGSHSNPAHAGDTLYAVTEVRDKWRLPGRADVGALRLRMLGLKNLPAAELHSPVALDGKPHPNLVLDLDYSVLMPLKPR